MKFKIEIWKMSAIIIITISCSFWALGFEVQTGAFSIEVTGFNSFSGSFTVTTEPRLTAVIPNQTWNINENHTGPDLDNYFVDGNGDTLTYTASVSDNPNINITIDTENVIHFTQPFDWYGIEYVVFTAFDNSSNATSNNVTMTVIDVNNSPVIYNYSYQSYNSNTSVNITEEDNVSFNISFLHTKEVDITVTWKLNSTIVKQEQKKIAPQNYTNSSEYMFSATYSSAGVYDINVTVDDGLLTDSIAWTLKVSNVNRPPIFNQTISNLTWNQGSTYTLESLDNYIYDPDLTIDDSVSYNYNFTDNSNDISVEIDSITNEVLFNSGLLFSGTKIVYFKVTDGQGAFNYSNNVILTIIPAQASQSSSGGGGGSSFYYICENFYDCSEWSECDLTNNTQTRTCVDLAECAQQTNFPATEESCEYIASCYDGIQNQDETGIDCGGLCQPCFTCYDGLQNQDETGIDCGGSCDTCATCSDGIQNCIKLNKSTLLCEEGIDCGGPCNPCATCSDGIQNQNETSIDCGGPCQACEILSPVTLSFYERTKPYITGGVIVLMLAALLLVVSKLIVLTSRKKAVVPKSDILNALLMLDEEINKLENKISSISKKRINTLNLIIVKFIICKFNIKQDFTKKELIIELSTNKKDMIVKNLIINIYSRLYQFKYSGDTITKNNLLDFIKEIKYINRLEIISLYNKKEKKKTGSNLIDLYKLYLARFYSLNNNYLKKLKSVKKLILTKENALPVNEKEIMKKVWTKKVLYCLSHNLSAQDKTKNRPNISKKGDISKTNIEIEKEFKNILDALHKDIKNRDIKNAKSHYSDLLNLYMEIKSSALPLLTKKEYYKKIVLGYNGILELQKIKK